MNAKEDIDKMPAGREMDALVAAKVMGWKWGPDYKTVDGYPVGWWEEPGQERLHWGCYKLGEMPPTVPHYSTDIAAAWEVVEKLDESGTLLWKLGREDHMPNWYVSMGRNHQPGVSAEAYTAPLAICRAALKAVSA